MATITDLVQQHYGDQIAGSILGRLESAVEYCGEDELSCFDQLHCRTRQATTELAALAGLRAGMHVLDIGAALGGSARHLAETVSVRVTGIDVIADFVRIARQLTEHAGLADRVSFERANALSAPFASDTFDCVWLQHVLPNIIDKPRLFAEARRVLRPLGCLALHEVVAIDGHSMRFPLPWARTPLTNFVARAERLRRTLESAGFAMRLWKDTSAAAVEWCRDAAACAASDTHVPAVGVALDAEALEAINNVASNIEAGRIGIVMAVFVKAR